MSMHALVVDDNRQILSIARWWLGAAGFDVTTSSDFLEGLLQVQTFHPDAIVVDVRLGEFNGLQLAIAARQRWQDVRIVVISAWDDPVLKRDAARCGAAYIQKPFTASQLLAAIDLGS